MNNKKPWSGRFKEKTNELVDAFTASIAYDARLLEYDIKGSIAHANALKKAGVLNEAQAKEIIKGLNEILADKENGKLKLHPELEDIHMNIESRLVEKIGEVGKKLHTGRSRNDQTVTALRLWLKDQINQIPAKIKDLQKVLLDTAEKNLEIIMPGYTHLQIAQPVLLAHHLLAYCEMLSRDNYRLQDCYKRVDVMPLGSAALAGTNYNLDREETAKELGFAHVFHNSIDAVSDRDFVVEFCAAAALLMAHLSRFCEELILWNSAEFKFIEVSDAFTTGSSIMPQKKNPDVCELIRGRTGRVYGNLVRILTVLKGLPLSYNRDLQEDKEAIFDTADTVEGSLAVLTAMIPGITFNKEQMRLQLKSSFSTAVDLADYLVGKGVAFRDAHEIVGRIVAHCLDNKKQFEDLEVSEFKKFSGKIDEDVYDAIALESSLYNKKGIGSTNPDQVREAIRKFRRKV